MRIVMLTDDKQIDRRILLEAETLCARGHEVIVLAASADGLPQHEISGSVKIERVIPAAKKFNIESLVALFFLKQLLAINWLSSCTQRGISKLSACMQRSIFFFFSCILRSFLFVIRKVFVVLNGFSRLVQSVVSKISSTMQRATVVFFTTFLRGALFCFRYAGVFLNGALRVSLAIVRRAKRRDIYEDTIYKRICYFDPDIIHVHDLPQLNLGALIKKKLNIPLVYDAHELYPEINTLDNTQKERLSKLENHLLPKCDAVITVNPFIAQEMASRYKVKQPQVILNATRTPELFSPDKHYDLFREKFSITADERIILFQGWMSKTRGLQTLVQAIQNVPVHIHLVFMGYGEAIPELKQLRDSLQLHGQVHFMEAVSQDELLYWTASADVGIIPYQSVDLNNHYCSPNKLFEFIQARLPILANDLPFLKQIVGEEAFGMVTPLVSVEDYARAIRKMFASDAALAHFKKNLSAKADKYSWAVEEEKLYTLYEQVIATVNA